jgi:hypothetical protein
MNTTKAYPWQIRTRPNGTPEITPSQLVSDLGDNMEDLGLLTEQLGDKVAIRAELSLEELLEGLLEIHRNLSLTVGKME